MVELDDVVVHVLDSEGNLNLIDTHLLELQAGHRAGSVLEQSLVYLKRHLLARLKRSVTLRVLPKDLGHQIIGHLAHHPLHIVPLTNNLILSQLKTRGTLKSSLLEPAQDKG